MASLLDELERKGYLSVNKLVEYLNQFHLHRAASYPTILKMVKDGKIQSYIVGSQHRIPKDSIDYYVEHGMIGEEGASAPSKPSSGELDDSITTTATTATTVNEVEDT